MNAVTEIKAESVYAKIAAVQAALAKTGIAKSRKNQQQGYTFRGIDEVYGALAPLLAEHRLCVIPRMLCREVTERQTQRGGVLFNVTVEAEFDFVSADDGTSHTARTFGEAMDSADKATNKAMSAAYKYAAFMTFAIPTEGDNDADATTHELAPSKAAEGQGQGDSQGAVSPSSAKRESWGGRYPNKTALHRGLTAHQAELRRIGDEGCQDDLDAYLTSPEYADFVQIATERANHYLEGGEPAPPEFEGCFALEQRARDMIALRGGRAAEPIEEKENA